MINIFESKSKTNRYVVKLKESDYLWLEDEYKKRNREYKKNMKYITLTICRFVH